jgi:hypothetical protein
MNAKDWIELAKIVPGLLWFLLAAVTICACWPTIKRDLIPNLTGFKALGVELTFARAQLDVAANRPGVQVSLNDRSQVLRRAATAARILAGMRVLWVDDEPSANATEVHLLNSLGISVDQITSTKEALDRLAAEKYDAVVSDIARGNEADAGIQMVAEMWNKHLYRWTIFYIRHLDLSKGTPAHAFGITNRPDHLLHFMLDIAERERL